MKIQSTNISFQQKYKTGAILQLTCFKTFEPEGFDSMIKTVRSLYGEMPKYLGSQGYRKYARILSEKILPKYPQIAEATKEINTIIEQNPKILPKELREKVKPVIEKLGEEIDIVI